jgi:hypothetical protein
MPLLAQVNFIKAEILLLHERLWELNETKVGVLIL